MGSAKASVPAESSPAPAGSLLREPIVGRLDGQGDGCSALILAAAKLCSPSSRLDRAPVVESRTQWRRGQGLVSSDPSRPSTSSESSELPTSTVSMPLTTADAGGRPRHWPCRPRHWPCGSPPTRIGSVRAKPSSSSSSSSSSVAHAGVVVQSEQR